MEQENEAVRAGQKTQVLFVDDYASYTAVVSDYLEQKDSSLSVVTATSVAEGLDRLAAGSIDCIVSDYRLAAADGIEFLRQVRADYPSLPFILLSGNLEDDVLLEAIEAGVTSYLEKGNGTQTFDRLTTKIHEAVAQFTKSVPE